MAHQIDPFCVHHLADTECPEADHNGGYRGGRQSRIVAGWRACRRIRAGARERDVKR
jgi:hypothetical protein